VTPTTKDDFYPYKKPMVRIFSDDNLNDIRPRL
jgi:hypothetical protein